MVLTPYVSGGYCTALIAHICSIRCRLKSLYHPSGSAFPCAEKEARLSETEHPRETNGAPQRSHTDGSIGKVYHSAVECCYVTVEVGCLSLDLPEDDWDNRGSLSLAGRPRKLARFIVHSRRCGTHVSPLNGLIRPV